MLQLDRRCDRFSSPTIGLDRSHVRRSVTKVGSEICDDESEFVKGERDKSDSGKFATIAITCITVCLLCPPDRMIVDMLFLSCLFVCQSVCCQLKPSF